MILLLIILLRNYHTFSMIHINWNKKIDVKKLQFGSKIDSSENKREDIFGVKEVLSPERIELSNGLKVKLLGIKENPQYTTEAVEFLKQKFKKRKV